MENKIYNNATLALMGVCLCVFAIYGLQNLEIEFLEATNGDEFPQILQFEKMFYGALNLNIKQFFAFEFYNYGFIYYFLNMLLSAVFFAFDNYAGAIYMPRILQGIFTILNIFMLYKIATLYLNAKNAFILMLIFNSMAGFYLGGMNVKPDFFQSFFMLVCVYFLILDNMTFSKKYILAIIALGLGVGVAKFQAIMFLPLIYSYICLPCCYKINKSVILQAIKRIFTATAMIFSLWIISNPYLLHYKGFNAWLNMFKLNMSSNATNHGSYVDLSISDKIFGVVDFYYFEIFVFAILLMLCVWIVAKFFKEKDIRFGVFASIVCGFIISLLYLLIFVNKAWASYYISTIVLGVVILGFGGGADNER